MANYFDHFGLTEPPFRLSPDPQFLYESKQHSRAKAYMESTIWLSDGFVVLTGEIGSGKTTIIESFLIELEDDVVLAQITQTQITPVEFLQTVLVEFGFRPFKKRKAELLNMLNTFLIEQFAAGRKVLLVIDEAQNLSKKVLEEIRLLSGIETHKEKVLRIILAGQPELNDKLDSPELEQLTQRVRLRFHLGSLSKRETQEYIEHRLKVAGAKQGLFGKETFREIYRYCGGIPRLVNILCDTSLLAAYAEENTTVTEGHVADAIEELNWSEYSQRSKSMRARDMDATSTGSMVLGRLIVERNGQPVEEYHLSPGRMILGRTSDNDLQIDSKFISRHHAQIISDLQQSVLQDLNSTNGVFLANKRIKSRRLRDGDVIKLGEHSVTYADMRTDIGSE